MGPITSRSAWPIGLVLIASLSAAPAGWSDGWHDDDDDDDEDAIEFEVAEVFFEFNSTDEDLGIHALIDGEAWKKLEIESPNERELLQIDVKSRLKRQGLTELFFESAEPPFDELSPRRFFRRFREGTYAIEGKTLDGQELEGEAEVTHLLPAAPQPTVNGEDFDEDCDDDDFTEFEDGDDVTIAWPPVTMSFDGEGFPDPEAVEIHNYELALEIEIDDEFASTLNVILPPDVTSFEVPQDFLDLGDEFKYEVLAREESFNQTAIESCFAKAED